MKITGFLLREAIRRWELRRDTAANQFEDSLSHFPGEEKQAPDEISELFLEAEIRVAKLQAAQSRYNLEVRVAVMGEGMTLCEAVKRLGGAGRMDKMWRVAAGGGKKERYAYRDDTRQAGEIRASRTIAVKDAMSRANKASAFAGALRAAVAKGNGTEYTATELNIDPSLFTE